MQISLKWINELIDITEIRLEELIKKLTLGGFEVEEIIQMPNNITLDISATANRSDSLTIQGFASEIGALLNQPIRSKKYVEKNSNWSKNFEASSYKFFDNSNCQTFFIVKIENLTNLTSPNWLQQKLIYSGFTPENNLYDFQTYVQLETGYPFELYDLDKIGLKSYTQDFTLSLSNLEKIQKVYINSISIGVAGISASDSVRCSNDTRNVLLEGSIFKAASVRQRSRLVGVRTDRSARYEKSIKDTYLTNACYRLISLLRIKNPNLYCRLHTNSRVEQPQSLMVKLRYDIIKEVLGPIKRKSSKLSCYILPQQITKYLTRLNFKQSYNSTTQTWDVSIPSMRSDDITEEIDLVEEVGRLHGFDNFLTQLPQLKCVGVEDTSYKARKKLTQILLNIGLTECVHYSLVNLERQSENMVTLINPLLSEYSNLRLSLLPNLIQTLKNNLNQGNTTIESFEYGHIFAKDSSSLITEKEVVAGLFGGTKMKSTWSTSARSINWFEAKGRLEQVFKKLNFSVYWKSADSSQHLSLFHPYRTSQLLVNGDTAVGLFGQISPILAKRLELPASVYLFELDFEIIKKSILRTTMVMSKKYPSYPKIVKDLSIIVSNKLSFDEIAKILYINGGNFLTEVNLVDEYKGESIPDFHTSLCLQFVFQSNEQTLQSQYVEKVLSTLKVILVTRFNAVIRD